MGVTLTSASEMAFQDIYMPNRISIPRQSTTSHLTSSRPLRPFSVFINNGHSCQLYEVNQSIDTRTYYSLFTVTFHNTLAYSVRSCPILHILSIAYHSSAYTVIRASFYSV